jgi:ribosomal protein S12 methylthiotransferase accessory factor
VPACLMSLPYSAPFREQGEQTIGPSISTGQAAAASTEAALLGGLCEVIERDAFSIAWLNRLSMPEVQIDSDPVLRASSSLLMDAAVALDCG